eukprot:538702_1
MTNHLKHFIGFVSKYYLIIMCHSLTIILWMLISNSNADTNVISNWAASNITFPAKRGYMVSGHDPTTDLIWFLGGWDLSIWSTEGYYRDIYTYNMTSQTFKKEGTLSLKTYADSQTYTQIGNIIYYQQALMNQMIFLFDMSSIRMDAEDSYLQLPASRSLGCMTSFGDKYLIYLGGTDTAAAGAREIQICDVVQQKWIFPFASNMIYGRSHFACAVYGDYVYAIGGVAYDQDGNFHQQDSSVEKLNLNIMLSNMTNMITNWELLTDNLNQARSFHRALSFAYGIMVVGGIFNNDQHSNSVEFIFGFDDSISTQPSLMHAVSRTNVILDTHNNLHMIYVIGGRDAVLDLLATNIIQISSINTSVWKSIHSNITVAPTTATINPTAMPTQSPKSHIETFSNITFDYLSFSEEFDGTIMDIGWVKYSHCTEGHGSNINGMKYWKTLQELVDMARYAITFKILPSNDLPYTQFALKAKLCSNPIYALNNGYELSYTLNTTTSHVEGYGSDDYWIGSLTAIIRTRNYCYHHINDQNDYQAECNKEKPQYAKRLIDGHIYWSGENPSGGIYLSDNRKQSVWESNPQCVWKWDVIFGHNITLWLGFDAEKVRSCVKSGVPNSEDYILKVVAPTFTPTVAPTSSPSVAPTYNPTLFPTNSPTSSPISCPYNTFKVKDLLQCFRCDGTDNGYECKGSTIDVSNSYWIGAMSKKKKKKKIFNLLGVSFELR